MKSVWMKFIAPLKPDVVADAAGEKPPTFTADYHAHKRTTLLTSAVLLALSLPGVELGPAALLWKSAGPEETAFLRFAVALAAAYYLFNFVLVWFEEAPAYMAARSGRFALVSDRMTRAADQI